MKPIIFSTPMIQGILEGRKTQTRRVIKPQPPEFADWFERKTDGFKAYMAPGEPCDYPLIKAPYKPGDILWVRETWCKEKFSGDDDKSYYFYKSNVDDEAYIESFGYKWRSSMFMPREAARIFLNVTNVRVERLQGITEEDAKAEGFSALMDGTTTFISARGKYHVFWNSLNSKRGYSWEVNPWVFVYEFERVEGLK